VIQSKRRRWEGHVGSIREKRSVCSILVRKPEGMRTLGRPRL
jgi:hypothetical protein